MPRAPEPPAAILSRPGRRPARASLSLRTEDFADVGQAARENLRRRISAWARAVAARLGACGLELAVCSVDDAGGPCALFLACGAGLLDCRAALVLGIDAERIRAGLELPASQAKGVRERLSNAARSHALAAALEALPEQFAVGIDREDASIPAPHCGIAELRTMLDRAADEQRPLWIGWRVPRDLAVEHAALLDEQLEDALAALARLYVLLTEESDGKAPDLRLKRVGPRRKRSARGLAEDEPEDTAADAPTEGPARRATTRARDDRRERDAEADQEPETDRATEATLRAAKAADSRPPPRIIFRRRRLAVSGGKSDPALPIERGARVRVLEGAFSGKVGVVHELDGKGGARVMLGLLALRLDVKSLTAQIEGRYRPVLSSSHRKPLMVRS